MMSEDDIADWLDREIGDAEPLFHSYVGKHDMVIEADRNGLLRFIRDLLGLANRHHFPYMHQHFDVGNFSRPEATSLAVYRIEKAEWKGAAAGKQP